MGFRRESLLSQMMIMFMEVGGKGHLLKLVPHLISIIIALLSAKAFRVR